MNENFYALSEEKQQRIINAAMEVFGKKNIKNFLWTVLIISMISSYYGLWLFV